MFEKPKPWVERAEKGYMRLVGLAEALKTLGLNDIALEVFAGARLLHEAIERGVKGKEPL